MKVCNSILDLHRGECKLQKQCSDDDIVCVFMLKVWHLGNTVRPLWLCWSTECQWSKHWFHLSLLGFCPVKSPGQVQQLGTGHCEVSVKVWAQQSVFPLLCQSPLSISFSCGPIFARSSFKSKLGLGISSTALLSWGSRQVRLESWKMLSAVVVSKSVP